MDKKNFKLLRLGNLLIILINYIEFIFVLFKWVLLNYFVSICIYYKINVLEVLILNVYFVCFVNILYFIFENYIKVMNYL